jgi:hypothetical protein
VPLAVLAAGPITAAAQSAVPADFVSLTDDTGTLTVGVPASWTELSTRLDVDFGVPAIKAAPDSGAFLSSFDAPGMTLKALRSAPIPTPSPVGGGGTASANTPPSSRTTTAC